VRDREAASGFAERAHRALGDERLRSNLRLATRTIQQRRAAAVSEVEDWEQLREAGRAIKARTLRHLATHLEELERRFTKAGGTIHWARDADEANRIVGDLVEAAGGQVVKAKSMTTEEIGLNAALEARGIEPLETDLAELIVQLAGDRPSHLLVPAIHHGKREVAELFRQRLPGCEALGEDPSELAAAARQYLRERFLRARVGISGANFAIAETGTLCIVESEGNARMCTTLPETLITVMGIEKVLPRWADLEVMLQLLPRSATGERMNPYTSLWSGVRPEDGPRESHLVLLDAGRTGVLEDRVGRQALQCIRCSACLNVCPVYERAGGHAYDAAYQGPIGAVLMPQLSPSPSTEDLPWASSLCGACYDVCPVKIEIPRLLIHLRGRAISGRGPGLEKLGMDVLARAMSSPIAYPPARGIARRAVARLAGRKRAPLWAKPAARWLAERDLAPPDRPSFRAWWKSSKPR
jgi:L-lactate dehydrogenase complex protein LldF